MTACFLCDINSNTMKTRIFYRDRNWFAVLAAPPHNTGHSILAAVPANSDCPKEPSLQVLAGLPTALAKTIETIKIVYKPKDVLLASLRGSEPHFHFHLVPLWENDERIWRDSHKDQVGYEKGHLMEFLGFVEKQASEKAEAERKKMGLSKEEQRAKCIASQKQDIEKLRLASGYYIRYR